MTSEINLDRLQDLVTEWAEPAGFKLLGPFANRHGGWVVDFCKAGDDGLDRFVTLGVSEPALGDDRWLVELYVSAEDDKRSLRRRVSLSGTKADDFDTPAWRETLQQSFEQAVQLANAVTPADLGEDPPVRPKSRAQGAD